MRGPNKPTRIPVDELRRRTWQALKAARPKRTGTMPAVDHVFQAVYVLGNAGLDTKAIAVALGVSDNYVRVARRNNAKKLMPTVEPEESSETSKVQRTTAAANKDVDAVVDALVALPLEEFAVVVQKLAAELDAWAVQEFDAAFLKEIGRDDLVQRIKARADVASS